MRIGNRTEDSSVQLSIGVPDGWQYKESFTILAPDGQANVILSSEPVDESLTRDEYATVQGELLKREFPGYQEITLEDFTLRDEGVAKLRVFQWAPEDGVPVTQAQIYYVVGQRGFTSTATTTTALFPGLMGTLLDVLRSISVTARPEPRGP